VARPVEHPVKVRSGMSRRRMNRLGRGRLARRRTGFARGGGGGQGAFRWPPGAPATRTKGPREGVNRGEGARLRRWVTPAAGSQRTRSGAARSSWLTPSGQGPSASIGVVGAFLNVRAEDGIRTTVLPVAQSRLDREADPRPRPERSARPRCRTGQRASANAASPSSGRQIVDQRPMLQFASPPNSPRPGRSRAHRAGGAAAVNEDDEQPRRHAPGRQCRAVPGRDRPRHLRSSVSRRGSAGD